jgi:hypothetical protein
MPDVAVELYTAGGDYFGAAITDLTGHYQFTNVAPGDYYLTFTAPGNYKFSPKDEGSNDALDSDADLTGKTSEFSLAMSEDKTKLDAGLILAGRPSTRACGRCWCRSTTSRSPKATAAAKLSISP